MASGALSVRRHRCFERRGQGPRRRIALTYGRVSRELPPVTLPDVGDADQRWPVEALGMDKRVVSQQRCGFSLVILVELHAGPNQASIIRVRQPVHNFEVRVLVGVRNELRRILVGDHYSLAALADFGQEARKQPGCRTGRIALDLAICRALLWAQSAEVT